MKTGMLDFVMAKSASDARGSELEEKKKLIVAWLVDVMIVIAIGYNFFYIVTLPCTLWFLIGARAWKEQDSVHRWPADAREGDMHWIIMQPTFRTFDLKNS
jgi:hypothetical protein